MISFCYQLFSISGIAPIFGGEKGNFSRPHISPFIPINKMLQESKTDVCVVNQLARPDSLVGDPFNKLLAFIR